MTSETESETESVHRKGRKAVNTEQAVICRQCLCHFPNSTQQRGCSKQQQKLSLPPSLISTCQAVRVQSDYLFCFPLICSNHLRETQLIHFFFLFLINFQKSPFILRSKTGGWWQRSTVLFLCHLEKLQGSCCFWPNPIPWYGHSGSEATDSLIWPCHFKHYISGRWRQRDRLRQKISSFWFVWTDPFRNKCPAVFLFLCWWVPLNVKQEPGARWQHSVTFKLLPSESGTSLFNFGH